MSANYREQLSALADGELSRDETRFLLRRLDADQDLAKSWTNYQIASDVLKKRFAAPMRDEFAVSVMQTIVVEKPGSMRGGLIKWAGGGAIAAAVAVLALTATRPLGDSQPATAPTVAVVTKPAQPPMPGEIRVQNPALTGFPTMNVLPVSLDRENFAPNYLGPVTYSTAPNVSPKLPADNKDLPTSH